jgi:2-iminoacetate synthase ThiH
MRLKTADDVLRALLNQAPLPEILAAAHAARDEAFGARLSGSRKGGLIPLTQLCRDVCRYRTFAKAPRGQAKTYLEPDDVIAIARERRPAARRRCSPWVASPARQCTTLYGTPAPRPAVLTEAALLAS